MKAVADVLGMSRSNLHDRLKGTTKPHRRIHKAQDATLLPLITALVTARPTHGHRRITAVLNGVVAELDQRPSLPLSPLV